MRKSYFRSLSLFAALAVSSSYLANAASASKSYKVAATAPNETVLSLSQAPTQVDAEEEKVTTKGSMKTTFVGRNIVDNFSNTKAGWLVVVPAFEVEYSKWLSMNASVLFLMGESAGQGYYDTEGEGKNLFAIDELSINVKPFSFLTLKVGALEGALNPLLSVMTPGTFIGAIQRFEFANDKETVKLALQANEQMPGEGVKSGTLVDQKKNPFFYAGMAQLDLKAEPISTTLKLAATQFQFGNLSNGTAKASMTKGNSPMSFTGQGDAADFLIGFAGVETGAALETEWTSRLTTIFKGSSIQNDRASADRNKGQLASAAIKYKMGNITWTPSIMFFNVEADVTPAAYSISTMRYHDRRGQKVELKMNLEKQKLMFFGNYSRAEEIVSNPYLADREIYNLGVEANYDLF